MKGCREGKRKGGMACREKGDKEAGREGREREGGRHETLEGGKDVQHLTRIPYSPFLYNPDFRFLIEEKEGRKEETMEVKRSLKEVKEEREHKRKELESVLAFERTNDVVFFGCLCTCILASNLCRKTYCEKVKSGKL
jgi:hypothetical protein